MTTRTAPSDGPPIAQLLVALDTNGDHSVDEGEFVSRAVKGIEIGFDDDE